MGVILCTKNEFYTFFRCDYFPGCNCEISKKFTNIISNFEVLSQSISKNIIRLFYIHYSLFIFNKICRIKRFGGKVVCRTLPIIYDKSLIFCKEASHRCWESPKYASGYLLNTVCDINLFQLEILSKNISINVLNTAEATQSCSAKQLL